jgi:hypothetical protein
LTEFLQRDTLLATEMQIFAAVLKWLERTQKSDSVNDGILVPACVRLHRMSAKRLADFVRPSGLVPDSVLVDVYERKLISGVFVRDGSPYVRFLLTSILVSGPSTNGELLVAAGSMTFKRGERNRKSKLLHAGS